MLHRTWACRVADIKLKKTLFPSLKFFSLFQCKHFVSLHCKKKKWVYDLCKLSKFFYLSTIPISLQSGLYFCNTFEHLQHVEMNSWRWNVNVFINISCHIEECGHVCSFPLHNIMWDLWMWEYLWEEKPKQQIKCVPKTTPTLLLPHHWCCLV